MPKARSAFPDIMLYLFDLETDSDFRSSRPEIIRLQITAGMKKEVPANPEPSFFTYGARRTTAMCIGLLSRKPMDS